MSKRAQTPQQFVQPAATPQASGYALLVRFSWMMLGHGLIAIFALAILNHRASFLSVYDLLYWAMVPVLIGIRYFDITRMHGQTGTGEPATLRDWQGYIVILGVACTLLWAVAHAAALYIR